jgi:type I restriction enzyme, S subunit
MEVRAGYKHTGAGVIPSDWHTRTIGESMRLINGRAFKPEDWKDRGLPIIRIQNLNDTASPFNFYSGPVEGRHCVGAGDLLFAWSGTTGTSFGARVWNGASGVLNQHIFKVIPNQKMLTPTYALLVLRKVQEQIEKRAHGFKASFVHVKRSDLVGIELPVPATQAEQEAIAEALSEAAALTESLEQLLVKKRRLKHGVMQELLAGKERLPGFSEEWDLRALGEIATANKGSQPSSSEMTEHGRFAHLNGGISASGYTDRSNALGATIAISEGGNSCGYVQFMPEPYCCGGHCYSVIPIGIDNRFLYHALKAEEPRIMGLRVGSGLPNVQKTRLLALKLRCPKAREEQTAIAAILFDMDAEIAALEARFAKARQLKQGMMQELLTGRIRLV